MTGKVGVDLSVSEAKKSAKMSAIVLLSVLKKELGELSRVKKVIKLNGMVNSSASFERHPEVIDGASELLVLAFGESVGKHARVAMGAGSLPFNIPVEIDLVVRIGD